MAPGVTLPIQIFDGSIAMSELHMLLTVMRVHPQPQGLQTDLPFNQRHLHLLPHSPPLHVL